MPYERGRRSRQTSTFMLDADVRVFDEVLAPSINGIASWTTETREPRGSLAIHRSLDEALEASGIQAFLRLEGEVPTTGPSIQYLATNVVGDSWTGPRVRPETPMPSSGPADSLTSGFPDEEPDAIKAHFSDLARD